MPLGSDYDPAVEVLRAVASPLRLAILVHLDRSPMAVQDLADRLAVSQPLVSHHLSVLRRAGLVTVQRSGRRAIHSTTAHPVVGLALTVLDDDRATRTRRTSMTTIEHARHTDHAHTHGEGCGHVAVPHVDHVDYAHDGHLHRVHDGHWDECETAGHVAHDGHDGHDHAHGEGCGHVAVPHGDHVDYLHDGHRHAAHDGYYDDH